MVAFSHLVRRANTEHENKGMAELFRMNENAGSGLGAFANRVNVSSSLSNHLYVGDKYLTDASFNLNTKLEAANTVGQKEFEQLLEETDQVLCGTDFGAVNEEWYRMFWCELLDTPSASASDVQSVATQFLVQFVDKDRVCVYGRGSGKAVLRVTDISQK